MPPTGGLSTRNSPTSWTCPPLGEVTGSQLRQGGIGATASLEASAEERRLLVRQAITRMAVNQWGFIEADENLHL
jgi:hypothetical protein